MTRPLSDKPYIRRESAAGQPVIRPCGGACGRMTRPSRRSVKDYPDTVARATAQLCQKCRDDESRAKGLKPRVGQKLAEAIARGDAPVEVDGVTDQEVLRSVQALNKFTAQRQARLRRKANLEKVQQQKHVASPHQLQSRGNGAGPMAAGADRRGAFAHSRAGDGPHGFHHQGQQGGPGVLQRRA